MMNTLKECLMKDCSNIVRVLYSRQCRELELVSLLVGILYSISVKCLQFSFALEFSCCPYYQGVRKARVITKGLKYCQ